MMEENLPANARRVGSCVVTRNADRLFDVTFMNGPTVHNLSVNGAVRVMTNGFECDHDEAETAVVHLMLDEAFK